MKNKFALCFRPLVIETREEISGDSSSPAAVSTEITVAMVKKHNRTVLPPSMSPSLMKTSGGSGVQVPSYPQPPNHSRKTLLRVLKTILFEPPPRMRTPGGKNRKLTLVQEKITNDLEGRKIHLEKVEDHKRKREVNIVSEENKMISSISSSSPSPSSSSIGTSSSSLSSYDQSSKDFNSLLSMERSLARSRFNTSLDKNNKAKITKPNQDKALDSSSSSSSCEDKDMVLYWMVLALLASILCGKILATLLATLWLYFIIPHGRSIIKPEFFPVRLPEIEPSKNASWEYKKKVIMEGKLDREAALPHTKH